LESRDSAHASVASFAESRLFPRIVRKDNLLVSEGVKVDGVYFLQFLL